MNSSTTPLRAVAAFLALPVTVAAVVPAALAMAKGAHAGGWPLAGGALIVAGFLPIGAAAVSFFQRGGGTLAPWDPPRRLVVEGLYRYNRNPMYVGVVTALAGWALATGLLSLALYAVAAWVVFHLRVTRYEEPEMRRLFGADWDRYRLAVPRWGLARRPFDPDAGRAG